MTDTVGCHTFQHVETQTTTTTPTTGPEKAAYLSVGLHGLQVLVGREEAELCAGHVVGQRASWCWEEEEGGGSSGQAVHIQHRHLCRHSKGLAFHSNYCHWFTPSAFYTQSHVRINFMPHFCLSVAEVSLLQRGGPCYLMNRENIAK